MPESTEKQAKAEVAKVEDYDSDASRAVDGTARHASQVGTQASLSRRSSQQPRKSHRDSHSDAGRPLRTTKGPVVHTATTTSSRHVVPRAADATTPTKTSSSQQEAPKRSTSLKPVVRRNDSGRTSVHADRPAPPRHSSCTDKNCYDPDCEKSRKRERRKTLVHLPQKTPQQQPATQQQYPVVHQYYQPAQYQYAPAHDPASMPPPIRPAARPRPVSVYGYAMPSQPEPHYAAGYAAPQMYASQPPTANMGAAYHPASPVQASPTAPAYSGYPSNTVTFSARQVNPALPLLGPPKLPPLTGTRHISARRTEDRRYHDRAVQYSSGSESVSETDHSSSSSEEDRRPRRQSSHRRRPSDRHATVIQHPSRPAVKKYYTEDRTQPTRRPRPQPLQRAGRSDSDVGDSDRTARAVIDRPSYPGSSRNRRPSVTTTSSSGRTRDTNLSSSNTDYSSHLARMTIEGKHGRRSTYLSGKDLRHQQKLRDDEEEARRIHESVDAYQRSMQGNLDPYELTAENMRKKDESRRRSNSYISSKSHRSSASQGAAGGGIKIQSGDTVLHVYGDAKVEMRAAGENGEPASFVIAGGGGGEGIIGGGSSSRSGRGRSEMRPRVIREENSFDGGYEVAR